MTQISMTGYLLTMVISICIYNWDSLCNRKNDHTYHFEAQDSHHIEDIFLQRLRYRVWLDYALR